MVEVFLGELRHVGAFGEAVGVLVASACCVDLNEAQTIHDDGVAMLGVGHREANKLDCRSLHPLQCG